MTEEKNKAIDCLKIIVDDINECGAEYYIDKDILSDIQTALNLIEKLQNENERQQDIIIEKDRQLHLTHKEIQSVREQAWEITGKSLKDILMLNTPKIIIESKEDIKGLLDNYIPKCKIREKREQEEKLLIASETDGAFTFREGKIKAYEELLEGEE